MNAYYKPIFSISIFQVALNNWGKKKQALLSMTQKSNFFKGQDTVESDFYTQQVSHNNSIRIIFQDEMNLFLNELKKKDYVISNSWFEKASNGQFHGVHNHGQLGYSAVCYIEYDETVHTPTQFVSPINDINDGASDYYIPTVKEGDLIIFPSMLLHYTMPNISDTNRLILSFNLKVN
jgi:hypothetical protein